MVNFKAVSIGVSIVSLLIGLCFPCESASTKQKPKMGWKLKMKDFHYGRLEWTISADGVVMSTPMMTFIVKPPNYDTQMFNTATKKFKTFKREQGFDRISMFLNPSNQKDTRKYSAWKADGKELVAGRQCIKWSRSLLNGTQNETHYSEFKEECWMTPSSTLQISKN